MCPTAATPGLGSVFTRSPNWLHQLDAVTKRISDVNPRIPFERLFDDLKVSFTKTLDQGLKFVDKQRGMGLPGRTEIRINAEVNLDGGGFEPDTASLSEVPWLWDFWNAQQQ